MLSLKDVRPFSSDYGAVKDLQRRAFPKNEQLSPFALWVLTLLGRAEMRVAHDGDAFCGFYYAFRSESMVFVLYLAVNDKVRSRGYGSRILDEIKSRTWSRAVVLNVEKPSPGAANNDQRVSRVAFYKRNGFLETGYEVVEGDDAYLVLTTDVAGFSPDAYARLLRSSSLGTYRCDIRPQ